MVSLPAQRLNGDAPERGKSAPPSATGDDDLQHLDATGRADRTNRHGLKLQPLDWFAISLLGLLPVAYLPGFYFGSNARQALVLASMPVGAWLLTRLATIGGDRSARLALCFVAVAALSALRAESSAIAFLGTSTTELSVLALLAALGWWAIGRQLTVGAVEVLPSVLTVGAVVNLLVGLFQIAVNPTTGFYQTFGGRLSGLMGNPVLFGSTFVGLWAYWFVRGSRSGAVLHLALTFVLASSVALTGSRGASVVGLLVVLVGMAARPTMRAALGVVSSVIGVVVGAGVLTVFAPSQTERLADANSSAGFSLRLEIWRTGFRVWAERPIIGWGPDPYLHRLNTAVPDSVYRDFDRLYWLDPHNVVVLVLVTTGLVGMILLALFVVSGLSGEVNWALLAASAAIVLSWMLQPVAVTTWPIAFAFFGAAVRPGVSLAGASPSPSRAGLRVLAVVGIILGLTYSAWSMQLRAATNVSDPDHFDAQAGWMMRDPGVALAAARFHKNAVAVGPELDRHLMRAEELAEHAVEQNGSAETWALLTEVQVLRRNFAAARSTADKWADEWPHDPVAHQYVALTARVSGDLDAEARALARSCAILGTCVAVSSTD